jgi:ankyrin repeat protein/ketosteroid isomerase-like protein
VPPRGLPGNANLEQLRNGAKGFQRAVRAGDPGAAAVVNEFHPRFGSALPGSPELVAFTRADAQLVVARQFGFPSWPRLKAHLELVADYARSPHHEPVGGPLADEAEIVDEFLRLVTLNYGDDDRDRLARAEALLFEHDWLATANVYTIAATGELDAARDLLADDPAAASRAGGPYRWEPLLYLTYARLPLSAGRSPLAVARLLLEHGADPNAGYLWEGLIPPFTAVTGALGGGGTIPKHPQELALARLLLEAGADPNDGQALYNQGWGQSAGEEWLELLFEFGLGSGDGGPWRRRFGERQDSPQKMLEDLLIAAAKHGLTDRVRRLLARGVDPRGKKIEHPIYRGRSPVQEAALNGHMDIVALLVNAGAVWEHDQVDELIATAMSGDRDAMQQLLATDAGLRERAIERSPDQLVRAAEQDSYDAVALLIELGFDVKARSRTAPLHEAAMRGNLPVIRLLLEHGADPNLRDTGYNATPAGWAEHHEQPDAYALLAALEQPDTRKAEAPADAPRGAGDPARAGGPAVPGAAMRTVAAAFTAVSERRFNDLAELVAPDIDWRGIAEADGSVPRCTTREQAIERMQIGLLARSQVSVSAFVEDGNCVLAHVHRTTDDNDPDEGEQELPPAERFVVAEVSDGLIVRMCGYATEQEARDDLLDHTPARPGRSE